ncbi:MAG TPA: YbaK/EbsC family protein [Cyclobacteriaceae bacterium]|nr:YbaK/EbsC family protein [Cyclobacteriaceae bacterium]
MKNVTEKIVDYLTTNGVAFEQITHPAADSAEAYQKTLNTRLEQQAKALFVRFKKTGSKGFVIVAIQAQKKADLDLVRRLIHANEVRLGTREQLAEITGCGYGELPPFGKIFSVPLVMDKDLLSEEKVYFNAGSLTCSVTLDPNEIARLENPILF